MIDGSRIVGGPSEGCGEIVDGAGEMSEVEVGRVLAIFRGSKVYWDGIL